MGECAGGGICQASFCPFPTTRQPSLFFAFTVIALVVAMATPSPKEKEREAWPVYHQQHRDVCGSKRATIPSLPPTSPPPPTLPSPLLSGKRPLLVNFYFLDGRGLAALSSIAPSLHALFFTQQTKAHVIHRSGLTVKHSDDTGADAADTEKVARTRHCFS